MLAALANRLLRPRCLHSCLKRQLRSVRLTRERSSPDIYSYPKLSPAQVTEVLRRGELSVDIAHEALLRFESNKLAANNPIEDRHAEARCEFTDGYLFGVFDGHAGVACAQAVSERLFSYIALNLLSPERLEEYLRRVKSNATVDLVRFYRQSGDTYVNNELASTYANSLHKFAQENMSSIYDWEESFTMKNSLIKGFERLDADMGFEALPPGGGLDQELLNVALSGSCAVVAHVDGPHLHVSNTGDCRAVLGSLSESGEWTATQLSLPHTAENRSEVTRIMKEHPNEQTTAIAGGRLLGQLAPLRAFGDYRYKWSEKLLRYVASKVQSGGSAVRGGGTRTPSSIPLWYYSAPPHYFTPPYLTATPEVSYHYLTPRDKFLVLASDGLWDALPSDGRVVQLVGDHMEGQQTVEEFKMPRRRDVTLGELSDMLTLRRQGIRKRAEDANAATHLIRNALGSSSSSAPPPQSANPATGGGGGAGGGSSGVVHAKLSFMLSLPHPYVRMYRDDITISVIYFNSDYLRTCPAA